MKAKISQCQSLSTGICNFKNALNQTLVSDMKTTIPQLEALRALTPHFPRRPRNTHRRRRDCFSMWKDGFIREKTVVKETERKNGKRKHEGLIENEVEFEGESVIYVNGEKIDLNLIARVGDGAYREELESMTKGMSREHLVGFMESLEGQWCGRSERRKVVDAAEIVKVLPINWKTELAVGCRAGLPYLYCRSYVSPTGMHFKSCKDAAIHLRDQSLIDVAGPSKEVEMRQIKNSSRMFFKSINEVTSSSLHEVNNNLPGTNDLYDVNIASVIDCLPCGLKFEDMGALEKHLARFHKKTTRRFNLPAREATGPHTLEKDAVMDHDEPRLHEVCPEQKEQVSSSSQKIAPAQEPVPIINGRFRTKCTWCNKEFLCKAVDDETMADATGFICPKCKEKLCGVLERSLSRLKV